MKLNQNQKDQVHLWLGYSPAILNTEHFVEYLNSDYSSLTEDRIDAIFLELDAIDIQLKDALSDSMAMRIDNLEVNYERHYQHLSSEGSRLLQELSNLTGMPIAYDKYKRRSYQGETKQSSNFFVSYY
jgi:uncharacterized membrane-anchored protein YhcB (DUF1043 family)